MDLFFLKNIPLICNKRNFYFSDQFFKFQSSFFLFLPFSGGGYDSYRVVII